MTRYTRSRLHEEVAAYLAFWTIVGARPTSEPEPEGPWIYLRRCIAALKGEDEGCPHS